MIKTMHDGNGIKTPFNIEQVLDCADGLFIRIREYGDSTRIFELVFRSIYGYRNFDESSIFPYLERSKLVKCGIYELKKSELLDWVASESPYRKVPKGASHYAVVSANDVFEAIAFETPDISEIND